MHHHVIPARVDPEQLQGGTQQSISPCASFVLGPTAHVIITGVYIPVLLGPTIAILGSWRPFVRLIFAAIFLVDLKIRICRGTFFVFFIGTREGAVFILLSFFMHKYYIYLSKNRLLGGPGLQGKLVYLLN